MRQVVLIFVTHRWHIPSLMAGIVMDPSGNAGIWSCRTGTKRP
ncbi:hypothetical protein B6254_0424 [Weissella cibaria]|uniref:Uncharacterized protein n=1 Tax=Weissella cibaria TaxID=137591 RepID=A0A2S1KPB0_9LACO|nr:hypothetical protein B6254_0424 [Weissella cibaria]